MVEGIKILKPHVGDVELPMSCQSLLFREINAIYADI